MEAATHEFVLSLALSSYALHIFEVYMWIR